MLRQFSVRRIIGYFFLDWFGSLALLILALRLRTQLGQLPKFLLDFLAYLHIQVGGGATGLFDTSGTIPPWPLIIAVAIIWPTIFISQAVYDARKNKTIWLEINTVFYAICLSMVSLAGFLFLTYRETSRGFFIIFFILDVLLLLGSRFILWGYRRIGSPGERSHLRNVLVIGAGVVGRNAVQQIKKFGWINLQLAGYLDDDPKKQGSKFEEIPVLGKLDQIYEVVNKYQIQDAVIALPMRSYQTLIDICEILQKLSIRVHVIPDIFALSFHNAELDGFGGIPVLDLGLPGMQGMQRLVKRVFDNLIAAILLILISPLMLAIAVLIKLDSPGPVLYRQKRIGENGKPFVMYKFRSMVMGADPAIHQEYVTRLIKENLDPGQVEKNGKNGLKMVDDPRITRAGRLIRKISLDELPQFFNVLRGEMSLVGPRPSLPYELEEYQAWHKYRLHALPGITGPWQVRGRNQVSFDEMVRMDLEYIERQSVWLDIKLILQTPIAIFSGKGAG